MPADLIVTNAKIYTMGPAQPSAEAMAVRDGKFLAVGSTSEMDALRGPQTQVIDMDGQPVLPGLCDSYIHLEIKDVSVVMTVVGGEVVYEKE